MPDNKILQQANEAYEKKDHAKARKLYAQLPEAERDSETNRRMAFLCQEQDSMDEAESFVQKSLELDPENFKAYANLAQIMTELGRYDEAEQAILKAIEGIDNFDGKLDQVWGWYGVIKFNQKEYKEAGQYFYKSLGYDPQNQISHWYLGQIFLTLKEKGYRRQALNEFWLAYKDDLTLRKIFDLISITFRVFPLWSFIVVYILFLLIIPESFLGWIVSAQTLLMLFLTAMAILKKSYRAAIKNFIWALLLGGLAYLNFVVW